MSHIQLSFAAFAQHIVCPPPCENDSVSILAVPAGSGREAGTSLPFDGLFIRRVGLHAEQVAGGVYGEFFMDWQSDGSLDAPDWLTSGGHAAQVFGEGHEWAYVQSFAHSVYREWQ